MLPSAGLNRPEDTNNMNTEVGPASTTPGTNCHNNLNQTETDTSTASDLNNHNVDDTPGLFSSPLVGFAVSVLLCGLLCFCSCAAYWCYRSDSKGDSGAANFPKDTAGGFSNANAKSNPKKDLVESDSETAASHLKRSRNSKSIAEPSEIQNQISDEDYIDPTAEVSPRPKNPESVSQDGYSAPRRRPNSKKSEAEKKTQESELGEVQIESHNTSTDSEESEPASGSDADVAEDTEMSGDGTTMSNSTKLVRIISLPDSIDGYLFMGDAPTKRKMERLLEIEAREIFHQLMLGFQPQPLSATQYNATVIDLAVELAPRGAAETHTSNPLASLSQSFLNLQSFLQLHQSVGLNSVQPLLLDAIVRVNLVEPLENLDQVENLLQTEGFGERLRKAAEKIFSEISHNEIEDGQGTQVEKGGESDGGQDRGRKFTEAESERDPAEIQETEEIATQEIENWVNHDTTKSNAYPDQEKEIQIDPELPTVTNPPKTTEPGKPVGVKEIKQTQGLCLWFRKLAVWQQIALILIIVILMGLVAVVVHSIVTAVLKNQQGNSEPTASVAGSGDFAALRQFCDDYSSDHRPTDETVHFMMQHNMLPDGENTTRFLHRRQLYFTANGSAPPDDIVLFMADGEENMDSATAMQFSRLHHSSSPWFEGLSPSSLAFMALEGMTLDIINAGRRDDNPGFATAWSFILLKREFPEIDDQTLYEKSVYMATLRPGDHLMAANPTVNWGLESFVVALTEEGKEILRENPDIDPSSLEYEASHYDPETEDDIPVGRAYPNSVIWFMGTGADMEIALRAEGTENPQDTQADELRAQLQRLFPRLPEPEIQASSGDIAGLAADSPYWSVTFPGFGEGDDALLKLQVPLAGISLADYEPSSNGFLSLINTANNPTNPMDLVSGETYIFHSSGLRLGSQEEGQAGVGMDQWETRIRDKMSGSFPDLEIVGYESQDANFGGGAGGESVSSPISTCSFLIVDPESGARLPMTIERSEAAVSHFETLVTIMQSESSTGDSSWVVADSDASTDDVAVSNSKEFLGLYGEPPRLQVDRPMNFVTGAEETATYASSNIIASTDTTSDNTTIQKRQIHRLLEWGLINDEDVADDDVNARLVTVELQRIFPTFPDPIDVRDWNIEFPDGFPKFNPNFFTIEGLQALARTEPAIESQHSDGQPRWTVMLSGPGGDESFEIRDNWLGYNLFWNDRALGLYDFGDETLA